MHTGRLRAPGASTRYGEPRRSAGGAKAGRWFLVALAIALAPAVSGAIDLDIDRGDIDRAQKLARGTNSSRTSFHAPYVVPVNEPVVERIEVVTEFRRMVRITEDRLNQGDRLFAFGLRAAQEALRPWKGRVSIVAHLRFGLQTSYMTMPSGAITIEGPPADVPSLDVISRGIYTGGDNSTLIGGTIDGVFDAASVGQISRPVSVRVDRTTRTRVIIDFSRLE
jgi:hypothetical protein